MKLIGNRRRRNESSFRFHNDCSARVRTCAAEPSPTFRVPSRAHMCELGHLRLSSARLCTDCFNPCVYTFLSMQNPALRLLVPSTVDNGRRSTLSEVVSGFSGKWRFTREKEEKGRRNGGAWIGKRKGASPETAGYGRGDKGKDRGSLTGALLANEERER